MFYVLQKHLYSLMINNPLDNSSQNTKEVFNVNHNVNRDFLGYNVLRDGALLDFTINTSYDDFNVSSEVEYCPDLVFLIFVAILILSKRISPNCFGDSILNSNPAKE